MRKKRETKLRANLKRKKKRANLIGYHEKAKLGRKKVAKGGERYPNFFRTIYKKSHTIKDS